MKRVSLQFCCQNGPLHLSAIFLHKDQQCTATSISLTHINHITVNPELLDSSKMHEVGRSKEADTWTRLNIPLLYKLNIQHANRNATCTRLHIAASGQRTRNADDTFVIQLTCVVLCKYCLESLVFPHLRFCSIRVNFCSRSETHIKSVHGIGF